MDIIEQDLREKPEVGKGQGVNLPKQGKGGRTKCLCPSCKYTIEHTRNVPCNLIKCPKCGSNMVGT